VRTTISTSGFKEMEAALGELTKATGKNVLKRAGLKAIAPVADVMKAKAPKDFHDLEEAIDYGSKRAKGAKKHFNDPGTVEVYAGVSVVGGGMPPQATQQEFGNEHHGPQPYGRPSWDQEKMPTLERTKDELRPELDRAVARARRKALKPTR
jgi:hypothetical protein